MKKNLLLIMLLFGESLFMRANAQWCVPLTALPYNTDMPGITHFILNTIDRVSDDLENFPNNNYVNTGLSTELIIGQTYNVWITFTADPNIGPDMNLRVWIDFNQDGQLDDIGETVITSNNQLAGTYTGNFTVPANASLGVTRMRATAKMTPSGGHTLPTPCDIPADPLGYHGEIEDYNVNIVNATGINSPITGLPDIKISKIPGKINFSFSINDNSESGIEILDLQGKKVKQVLPLQRMSAGKYSYDLNTGESEFSTGIYLAVFNCNNNRIVKRIVIE